MSKEKKLNMEEETDCREWVDKEYLSGWEVKKSGDINKVIKTTTKKPVYSPKHNKDVDVTILHFTEGKPMILNSKNRKALIIALKTSVMQQWVGKTITLTTEFGTWFGNVDGIDALRISTKAPKPVVREVKKLPILKADTKEWDGAVDYITGMATTKEWKELLSAMTGKYKISAGSQKTLKDIYDKARD